VEDGRGKKKRSTSKEESGRTEGIVEGRKTLKRRCGRKERKLAETPCEKFKTKKRDEPENNGIRIVL